MPKYQDLANKYKYKYLTLQAKIGQHTPDYNFPVDAVITWVDGNDPEWQMTYQKEIGRSIDNERYIDINELYYCLTSISQYLPWLRNIFLVTMRPQQPKYLSQFPKVKVVYHEQIYNNSNYLPTFNSMSIETQLDNIPGLSEHFIYFNDDVFIGKYLDKQYFFSENGMPILYKRDKINHYCQSTMEIISNKYGFKPISHTPNHYAQPLTKSGYKLIYNLFKPHLDDEAIQKIRRPLHSGEHFWIIFAIYLVYYQNSLAIFYDKLPDKDGLRFYMPNLKPEHAKEKLAKYRLEAPAFININNIDANNKYHMSIYQELIEIFNRYLPLQKKRGISETTKENTNKLLSENTDKLNKLIRLGNKIINSNPKIISKNLSDIPIYYLNLDRSTIRNKWMLSQFKKYHINNYLRISAVDGNSLTNLTQGNYRDLFNYQIVNPGDFVTFNSGVLGCCLTHLYAILQAYLNHDSYVIIMEDDCNLCLIPFWKQSLGKLIQNAPANWKLIQLITSSEDCLSEDLVSDKYYSGTICKCAAAYLINREGMKYLLDLLYNSQSNTFILKNSLKGVKPLLHADWFIFQHLIDHIYYTLPLFCLNNTELPSQLNHNDVGHLKVNMDILRYYL